LYSKMDSGSTGEVQNEDARVGLARPFPGD
jgi:hypothetical protein